MSKIKLTGESSGYVEISAGNAAGNNTLEAPTSGTRLVAHEGSQDVTLNGNLTVNGVISYEDTTNIDSVGVVTARNGLHVTGGNVGIGTDNPAALLNPHGTAALSNTNQVVLISDSNADDAAGRGGNLGFAGYVSGNLRTLAGIGGIKTNAGNSFNGDLGLYTRVNGQSNLHERLRITSAGKVGINTASPRAVLDVEGNAENATLMLHSNDANANLQFSDNTGGARILNYGGDLAFRTGTNAHVFGTGDTEKLRITSAGNVGINEDNPQNSLHISGSSPAIRFADTDANGSAFSIIEDNNGLLKIRNDAGNSGTGSGITFEVDAGEKLRISSSGLIGINDTDPRTGLTIAKWGTAPTTNANTYSMPAGRWVSTWNTSTANNVDYWAGFGGGGYAISSGSVNIALASNHNNFGQQAGMYIAGEATSASTSVFTIGKLVSGSASGSSDVAGNQRATKSELMRVTGDGKVGINQASPFAELDITSTTETTTGTLSQHGIRLSAPGAADGEVIPITGGFLSNQDRARAGIGFISRVAGSSVGYAGAIGFYTRSSADGTGLLRTDEKVRINESGTLIVDAGGEAQDIQIISHSAGGGHGKIYLRGNASNESSSIQLNHYGHADYHISAGRAANGLFSITRTQGGTDGIIMNANGNVGIKNTGTSAKLHIGDLVGSISNDINTTHTSLIIKQTNNDNKSGIYIERSGERKGYYMWMNPGGGAGDALTFTRNNAGTKSDALILDRDANLTAGGHIYPSSNNTYDLGSTANAWRNIYTNDLHLSNMSGGGNDVDGTTGDWTIQEGEENLYIINNRSGKKYKFNLQEVN